MNVKSSSYTDVYYQPGECPVFCFRSGLAVYEETLDSGVLAASGWNCAGYPLNVLSGCPTRLNHRSLSEPSSFGIEIDGRSIDYALKFVGFETSENGDVKHSVLTLDSGIAPVRLMIHTLIDGTQMLTRYIEIQNMSDKPICVSRLVLFGGGLDSMERGALTRENDVSKLYSLGYFDNDCWGREGEFSWHDLPADVTAFDTRYCRERYRHPAAFVRCSVTGKIFFMQLGWSGGCRFTFDNRAHAERGGSILSFKAEITGRNPLAVIGAGETFTTPEIYMGAIAGGLDDAVNEMHAHIRKTVLCRPETDPRACLVGAGMGAEHDMSVETTKAFMRQFAEMGAEVFIIDAGWECPPASRIDWHGCNGRNRPDPLRYPNGLSELSDYCRSLEMKFGLWVEIERLGAGCDVFASHPEWRAHDIYGNRSAAYLDLTVPEAYEWASGELERIVTEYKLDLLRVDYNVGCGEYFAMRDTGYGMNECISVKQFEAVYRMYGDLKRRHPEVIFENCAGGGGRTDLGIMRCFNHTWVSDWQKMPHSVMITDGMTMVLPPERVDRLFAGMGCHEFGTLDAQMRNTMLTHMTLNVVSPASAGYNPVQMEFIKHSVKLYKNFIRGFLPECKVYHHTPEQSKAQENGFSALEIASPDGKNGAAAVFTLSGADGAERRLIMRGIRADLTYKVTLDNSGTEFTASGYELLTSGVPVRIPSSMSSELITYKSL